MTREVCFIIGTNGSILWADTGDCPTALPDSRARWEAIWRHRAELAVIAHSHPVGPAAFSAEDRSTMTALEDALGTAPLFMIVTPDVTIVRDGSHTNEVVPEPAWVAALRLASGMTKEG